MNETYTTENTADKIPTTNLIQHS